MGLEKRAPSSAPVRPPAALAMPKCFSTCMSIVCRRDQKRIAVAMRCGMETATTASFVPTLSASSGVSTLPIPNPASDAIAPARIAATNSRAAIIYLFVGNIGGELRNVIDVELLFQFGHLVHRHVKAVAAK